MCNSVILRTAAHQASLSFTISRSVLKLRPTESVMPSNHLILCHPLFLLPSIFPSIRVFSSESLLRIRWPKYWSFSFSIRPGLGTTLMAYPTLITSAKTISKQDSEVREGSYLDNFLDDTVSSVAQSCLTLCNPMTATL